MKLTKNDSLAILILILGSALRLLWPTDLEWKYDQIWMFNAAHEFANQIKPFDWMGMTSSAGVPNPGLSVWVFIQIAKFTTTPVQMTMVIQWINVICLWGFWLLFRNFGLSNGILWMAVAPIPIFLSRIIWAQSLVLPFVLIFMAGYLKREKYLFAFLWGLFGLLMGQVHMAGFFLFASVTMVTVWLDWKAKKFSFKNWIPWAMGCLVGALPLIPWLKVLVGGSRKSSLSFWEHFNPKLFSHAFTTLWGVNLNYLLGTDFVTVLKSPISILVIALALQGSYVLYKDLKNPKTLLPKKDLEKRLYLAFLVVYFLLFQLAGATTYVHYLVVVFPVVYIWGYSRISHYSPKFFWLIIAQQLILSFMLLYFIHDHCGADHYGAPYRCQQ
jgi:hypothetical protein